LITKVQLFGFDQSPAHVYDLQQGGQEISSFEWDPESMSVKIQGVQWPVDPNTGSLEWNLIDFDFAQQVV
jgi:hypothetical protein